MLHPTPLGEARDKLIRHLGQYISPRGRRLPDDSPTVLLLDEIIAQAKAEAVEPLLHTLNQARIAWADVSSNLPSMESNIGSIRNTAERERRWAEEAIAEARHALSTSADAG